MTDERATRMLTGVRTVLLGVCLSVQLCLGTPALIAGWESYRSPATAVGGYTLLLALTLAYGWWVLRRHRPVSATLAVVGVCAAIAASVVASVPVPGAGHFTSQHWSFGLVGWLLILLLSGWPLAVTAAAVCGHVGANVVLAAATRDSGGTADAAITIVSVTSFQLAAAYIGRLLHRQAAMVDAAEAERDRLIDHELVTLRLHQAWRGRIAHQAGGTLAVLAGIADRTADPRRAEVRTRCARAAAQLRRLFAEHDDVPDRLVHELSASLDVAEQQGVDIVLAVSGTVQEVPTEARRELIDAVLGALDFGPTSARVSVLRTPGDVRVAVVCPGRMATTRPPPTALVTVQIFQSHRHTRMEARWSDRTTMETSHPRPSSSTTTRRSGRASSTG